jgi:hypothetical protein
MNVGLPVREGWPGSGGSSTVTIGAAANQYLTFLTKYRKAHPKAFSVKYLKAVLGQSFAAGKQYQGGIFFWR